MYHNADGILDLRYENECNDNGNNIKYTRYDKHESKTEYVETKYDDSGRLLRRTSYDCSFDEKYEETTYEYTTIRESWKESFFNGKISAAKVERRKSFSGDNNTFWSSREYNSMDDNTEFITYRLNGEVYDQGEYVYEYDNAGNMLDKKLCDIDMNVLIHTEYEYDTRGNLLSVSNFSIMMMQI